MSIVAVAEVAGVSFSTVARVINRHPSVSPETAVRVMSAMRDMGYEPPPPSKRRGPRTAKNQGFRTRNIAKLMVAMDEAHLRALSAPGVVAEALSQYGLNLLFVPMSDPKELPSVINPRQVDGVIIQGLEPTGKAAEALRRIPSVWMMTRRSETFWADYVQPDNAANGRIAAEYLLGRGHRRIGVINLQPNYPAFRQRIDAFVKLVTLNGAEVIIPPPELMDSSDIFHPGSVDKIKEQVHALIDKAPDLTALYLTSINPLTALYRELRARGREPLRDVEIVVGDNQSDMIFNYDPLPVCVDVQIPVIAQRAVDQLVWRICHPEDPGPVGINIPPRLVFSGSI
jgi:LacI family transcriptional regulator